MRIEYVRLLSHEVLSPSEIPMSCRLLVRIILISHVHLKRYIKCLNVSLFAFFIKRLRAPRNLDTLWIMNAFMYLIMYLWKILYDAIIVLLLYCVYWLIEDDPLKKYNNDCLFYFRSPKKSWARFSSLKILSFFS